MKKLGDAEQGQRRAQADATALRAGVDPDALTHPLGDEPPSPVSEGWSGHRREEGTYEAEVDPFAASAEDEIAPGPEDVPASDAEATTEDPGGLRKRLALAALSKKGRAPKDVDDWR